MGVRFFTPERVNWISLVIGVVGLVTGVWFYVISVREPRPTYFVDPVRTRIIDTASGPQTPSDFAVLFRGQKIDASNVTAVRVYFWNAGKAPIHGTDVLHPFRIMLDTAGDVLETRVLRSTRSVVEFAVDGSAIGKPFVTGTFRIMERNDGAVVQIIYTGNPDADVRVEGVVIGAPGLQPVRLDAAEWRREQDRVLDRTPWLHQIWAPAALGLIVAILGLATTEWITKRSMMRNSGDSEAERFRRRHLNLMRKLGRLYALIIALVFIGLFGWTQLRTWQSVVPPGLIQ